LSDQTKIAGAGSKVSGTDPRIRIRTYPTVTDLLKESEPFLEQVPELHELLLPPAELRPLGRQLLLQPSNLTVPVLVTEGHNFWMFLELLDFLDFLIYVQRFMLLV
jgi:hypothetical protein